MWFNVPAEYELLYFDKHVRVDVMLCRLAERYFWYVTLCGLIGRCRVVYWVGFCGMSGGAGW
jgi:hypothetical protein